MNTINGRLSCYCMACAAYLPLRSGGSAAARHDRPTGPDHALAATAATTYCWRQSSSTTHVAFFSPARAKCMVGETSSATP